MVDLGVTCQGDKLRTQSWANTRTFIERNPYFVRVNRAINTYQHQLNRVYPTMLSSKQILSVHKPHIRSTTQQRTQQANHEDTSLC